MKDHIPNINEAMNLVSRAMSADKLDAFIEALPNSNLSAYKLGGEYWKLLEAKRRLADAQKAYANRVEVMAEDLLNDYAIHDMRKAVADLGA